MTQVPAHPIPVLVAHSDPLLRAGLVAALAGHEEIAVLPSTVQRAEAGTEGLPVRRAEVVISDYPNLIAMQPVRALQVEGPAVIVIAIDAREAEVRDAIQRGVRGYLTADCSFEELASAVRAVHRGSRYLCDRGSAAMAESLTSMPLTPREQEVLQLLAEGCPNKIIARRLAISEGTVKSHVRGVMTKLGVNGRTHAVVAAEKRGLIPRERGLQLQPEVQAIAVVVGRSANVGVAAHASKADRATSLAFAA
jgi:DNA-binding NarL/FixJ family response regulator